MNSLKIVKPLDQIVYEIIRETIGIGVLIKLGSGYWNKI